MLHKLQNYFPGSKISSHPPEHGDTGFYWFHDGADSNWIGIPKKGVQASQLDLLKNLFEFNDYENAAYLSGLALAWHRFLLQNGNLPPGGIADARFIQFSFTSPELERPALEEALKEFFPENIILWLNESDGVIIEEKTEVYFPDEEVLSIAATFESDFFIRVSFYIGKFKNVNGELPSVFQREKHLFSQARILAPREKAFSFEKIFPLIIAANLSEELQTILASDVLAALSEDEELMATMKVFLENNSNASLTAKKLYIHRNTLQYRLDKFMEKTGVNLKDFSSAITVYLACLLDDIR
ncbi:PucR family transcriptional regulator [Bacillus sp. T33-2]|uniref:PucR family transcriptional regulator n=1 Tax=Bacillus sp. T33-2 TaxID=2054168 RepID=UPI000C764ECC|nr:helix-turn-helix domain-containing protein [Bacillus sp. T33-2]PLR89934.1 hypothetical protein CVD19_22950 [Bacillus sp. T33-2]